MTSGGDAERKWLIDEPPGRLQPDERARYWERVHQESDYADVYSLTDDRALRELLVADLREAGARRILIPGCGSRTALQREIVERLPGASLTCVDFAGVVEVAARRFSDARVEYRAADVTTLQVDEPYDAVVHVTSVVSESDTENRDIVQRTVAALKPGGLLLGVFPTVFATLDIAHTTNEVWRAERVDLPTSTYSEAKQAVSQIFYTPLRLRRIVREAGLTDVAMSLFFNDSPYLRSEGARHYDLQDEDAVLYHLYVRGRRPA